MSQRKKSKLAKHAVEIRQHTCRRSMQRAKQGGEREGNHLRAYVRRGKAEWDDREL